MKLRVDGAWAHVEDATEHDLRMLSSESTFVDTSVKPPRPVMLLDGARLPAGLAIWNNRAEPRAVVTPTEAPETPWLRDYQADAAERLLAKQRGICWLPPGAGKTVIACAVMRRARARWLVLCPTTDLVDQGARRYLGLTGERAGRIRGGVVEVERVTFATYQSGDLAGDLAVRQGECEGLILDEVHRAAAPTWYEVAMGCQANLRFGFSATPLSRDDGRDVLAIAATGPVVYSLTARELVARGVLARCEVNMVSVRDEFYEGRDWRRTYERGIVRSEVRNAAVIGAVRDAEKPCLVLVSRIQHGFALVGMLRELGVSAEFCSGKRSPAERRASVRRLERRDVDALVASGIFDEGIDIPEVRSVVVVSAGRSEIKTIQRLGRGMRAVPGKEGFTLWDFTDSENYILARHASERMRVYQKEGWALHWEVSAAAAVERALTKDP